MTVQEALHDVLQQLPEDKLKAVLEFAEFLSWKEEREAWQAFGIAQLARADGDNEPEYSLANVKSALRAPFTGAFRAA